MNISSFDEQIIDMLLSYEPVNDDSEFDDLAALADEYPDMLEPRWLCNQPVPEMLEPIIEALIDGEHHTNQPITDESLDEAERMALWLESWARPIWKRSANGWVEGFETREYGWTPVVAFAIRNRVRIEQLNCCGQWNDVRMRRTMSERRR